MSKIRRYHLGLDWGTSTTKLVLRDYEQRRAFVLFPTGDISSYRYPSTIVISDGHIYFGFEAEKRRKLAEKVIDALKTEVYEQSSQETASVTISEKEDLATLYLAHVISVGADFAEEHAKQDEADALMGMTVGIPAEELDNSSLRYTYLRMARCAYELAIRSRYNPQQATYDNARKEVQGTRDKIKRDGGYATTPDTYKQWLRPELAAAMYWGIKSPKIEPDLYSCIDIGAWTTNVSYFRIHSSPGSLEKDSITFFGGETGGPGVIELLKKVAYDSGEPFVSLLGCESERLCRTECSAHIDRFKTRCFQVWEKGFRKAYRQEPFQTAWDGKVNTMVVGGGSKIPAVRKHFHETFPHDGWNPGPAVPDLGTPSDLYHYPKKGVMAREPFNGDYTFLLVSYGLSVHGGDFPNTTLGSQCPPFDPQARTKTFHDSVDLGYDKK